MSDPHDELLARDFSVIARQLQAEDGAGPTQDRITRTATHTVDGCDHAAISLVVHNGVIRTVAATDDVPVRVDALQYEVREGPCLDSIRTHDVFMTGDLAVESRWPRSAARAAAETGVRSMLAVRLFLGGDTIGALNLYSRTADAFDDHSCAVAAILAAHGAVALTAVQHERRAEQLASALESNRRIGVAMGVLMAREHVDEDEAFALLRRASQRLNLKLRDVADQVVETGRAPHVR
ncbi:GAF and ANTAR domain-containing protein [Pseudonocardia xishanensis]|uniref:GAF and ANTAR domain-containing protein n=1 Tax=Pseudonocardia xishanensis TaxID=630995 RepID=A0ABP8RLU7_9PSEU